MTIDAAQQREIIARKIQHLRKLHYKSQSQIANKIKINKKRYAAYEEGRNVTPYRIIVLLCQVYEISLDYFERLEITATPRSQS